MPFVAQLAELDERLEPRVELTDRLVAEVEQIGVEEGQVVVGLAGAGHVRARPGGRGSLRDPRARRAARRRARGPGSGRRRRRRRRPRDRRPARARRRRCRSRPAGRPPAASSTFGSMPIPATTASASSARPSPSVTRPAPSHSIPVTVASGSTVDAALAVVVDERRRQLGGEDARPDPGLREDHRDRGSRSGRARRRSRSR